MKNMTSLVAILGDGELGRRASCKPPGCKTTRAKRHCTRVGRSKSGKCVCKKWGRGAAKGGQKLPSLCKKANLPLAISLFKKGSKGRKGRRGRGVAGFYGVVPADVFAGVSPTLGARAPLADAAWDADAHPMLGDLPSGTCRRWEMKDSPAFGRPVKVCTDFAGSDDEVETDDGDLAGPLAKWYGLGQVGGGLGPTAGVVGGGIAAIGAGIVASRIAFLGRLGALAGPVLAGAVAGVLAFVPATRTLGIGALLGVGTVTAALFAAKAMGVKLDGFGAIVPDDLGAIVPDDFGAYGDIDVLSGHSEARATIGLSPSNGVDDDVTVLSGSFGSLPIAGAI